LRDGPGCPPLPTTFTRRGRIRPRRSGPPLQVRLYATHLYRPQGVVERSFAVAWRGSGLFADFQDHKSPRSLIAFEAFCLVRHWSPLSGSNRRPPLYKNRRTETPRIERRREVYRVGERSKRARPRRGSERAGDGSRVGVVDRMWTQDTARSCGFPPFASASRTDSTTSGPACWYSHVTFDPRSCPMTDWTSFSGTPASLSRVANRCR
jgi:hypothetical protein